MSKFDRYLFWQYMVMFGFFSIVLILIYWINRAVSLFDQLISDGQSLAVFFEFSFLTLAPIVLIVTPLATFASAIFVTNKLKNDSELTVMQATGFSPWRLARPAIVFGTVIALMVALLAHFVVPYSQQQLKQRQSQVSASLTSKLFRDGIFVHPDNNLTFYIRQIEQNGELSDVFIVDERTPKREVIYNATKGKLARNNDQSLLILYDGVIQFYEPNTNKLSSTHFSELIYDLTSWTDEPSGANRRYIYTVPSIEIWKNPIAVAKSSNTSLIRVYEEFNSRFVVPFLSLVSAIIGFGALLMGGFSRFGTAKQVSLGIFLLVIIKLVEGYANDLVRQSISNWYFIYLPIVVGFILFAMMLVISTNTLTLSWFKKNKSKAMQ